METTFRVQEVTKLRAEFRRNGKLRLEYMAAMSRLLREHGIGIEKINSMCVQFSAEENAQMLGVKRAFDPQGTLNPGKVIPTHNRCAEYGKMHVHAGNLKFPDLPRF